MKTISRVFFILFLTSLLLGMILMVCSKALYFRDGTYLPFHWLPNVIFVLLGIGLLGYRGQFKPLGLIFLLAVINGLATINFHDLEAIELTKSVLKTTLSYVAVPSIFVISYSLNKEQNHVFFNVIKLLMAIISVSVFVGYLFQIPFMRTYTGFRFGFSGLLYPSSFSSYFMIFVLSLFYLEEPNNKSKKIFLAIVLFASLLVGTKSIYFFLSTTMVFLSIRYKWYSFKKFWILVVSFVGLVLLFSQSIINWLHVKFSVLYKVYQNDGFITFVLSYRDIKLKQAIEFMSTDWQLINFFIGGNKDRLIVEMAPVDFILSFGFAGVIVYVFLWYEVIFKRISLGLNEKYVIIIVSIITLLSGNFFKSFLLAYFIAYFFSRPSIQLDHDN